jgi:hypothetical protein
MHRFEFFELPYGQVVRAGSDVSGYFDIALTQINHWSTAASFACRQFCHMAVCSGAGGTKFFAWYIPVLWSSASITYIPCAGNVTSVIPELRELPMIDQKPNKRNL